MKYPNARRQHTRTIAYKTAHTSFSHIYVNLGCDFND